MREGTRTEESNGASRPRQKTCCAMGMGREGVLDRTDERAHCCSLQPDSGGVLQRRLWLVHWRWR